MLRRLPLILAATALIAAPASAAMTVATFLARANALKEQGVGAIMSPDFQVLRGEAKSATTQLKAERAARAAAGKPPIACIPEGESVGIMTMLDGLGALSPAEKKLPLKDGYAKVLTKQYPCR